MVVSRHHMKDAVLMLHRWFAEIRKKVISEKTWSSGGGHGQGNERKYNKTIKRMCLEHAND